MNNSVHFGALDFRNFFKKSSAKVTVVGIYHQSLIILLQVYLN